MSRPRVVVVGAGIMGLAHAWFAAASGAEVVVLERSARAEGASVRNFGMIWPIGQPPGAEHACALRSRALWESIATEAGIWWNPCGSIHLAHAPDEWRVLEEFASGAAARGYTCTLLSAPSVLARAPGARAEGLLGGLYSPTEAGVDPRATISGLTDYLSEVRGVRFRFGVSVRQVETGRVILANGTTLDCERVILCVGTDVTTLFPESFLGLGLRRCKLQMMRTPGRSNAWRIGPHLASGLTLRHYANFGWCESRAALAARVAERSPELDRWGIHVMLAQLRGGEVILGDSHEYDDEIEPFDSAIIEALMLRELRAVFDLPEWTISARWNGTYLRHPEASQLRAEPLPGVSIRTGLGGSGMTMSFGLAEQDWDSWT